MLDRLRKIRSINILKGLRYRSGLFAASKKQVSTGYNKAWIRDNVYEALGLEKVGHRKSLVRTYNSLFDIFLKHEEKIDWAIREKPDRAFKYIHARFHPLTFREFHEEWGNKQNDAIGAFLFKVGDLLDRNVMVIRDRNDLRILEKLVKYLWSIEYWHDEDNGMWEENEEVHASSVGACVAGLRKISRYISVPKDLIDVGQQVLDSLLPHESATKKVDLALLSLIYPYNIANPAQARQILRNVERHLVRKNGVIRYIGDRYYNNGREAEWTMGFPWLAVIYRSLGDPKKHGYYLSKTHDVMNWKMELPELYYGDTSRHNPNSPLGWSQALYLNAL
ncbi:glycoside hydrolase family 15 [Candidatus Woesearchaeota archaeon]|nr:glycoside hydrolase family 15 [Candidatus Woesearchaeota archaeon]